MNDRNAQQQHTGTAARRADAFDTMLARHRAFLAAPRRRRHGRRAGGGGASLVEVLIVLVILLIGVFAVIRVWPIGFGTLRQSERRLRADRLNRNLLDQIGSEAANLPESISMTFWGDPANPTTVTDIDPDDLGVYGATPAEQDANRFYFSDINKFRYVRNEPVKVPLATGATFTNGAPYLIKFGPLYMDPAVGTPTAAPNTVASRSYLNVVGEPLFGIPANAENPAGGLNDAAVNRLRQRPGAYLIDYGGEGDTPYIMFPPAAKQISYELSFSFEGDTGTVQTVVQQPVVTVDVPAAASGRWLPVSASGLGVASPPFLGIPTGAAILPGSERVARAFNRIGLNDPWDINDPYEYKLISPNVAGSLSNPGLIAFNPAGGTYSERTPYGQRAFTALVSYAVLDWHIIKDDREVPAAPVGGYPTVRTSLPNILPLDEEIPDSRSEGGVRRYDGLYPGSAGADRVDIQLFNLTRPTGLPLVGADMPEGAPPAVSTVDYYVNRRGRGGTYPTGIIYINPNSANVRTGDQVRILYKVQGEWGVALQKAATRYTQTGAEAAGARPATGLLSDSNFAVDTGTSRLYFHRSELNKSVLVTLEADYSVSGGNTGTERGSPVQVTIDNADGQYAFVEVGDFVEALRTRAAARNGGGATLQTFRVVNREARGVSLKTRVVYKDNANARNPWRVQDLETFQTPAAGLN